MDQVEHFIHAVDDVIILKTEHRVTKLLECVRSAVIAFNLFHSRMSSAIDFDDKFHLAAQKISDIWPNGCLPHELQSTKPAVAQLLPQALLCNGFVLAQCARSEGFLAFSHVRSLISPIAAQWVPFFSRSTGEDRLVLGVGE
jgi:hypothetical protein